MLHRGDGTCARADDGSYRLSARYAAGSDSASGRRHGMRWTAFCPGCDALRRKTEYFSRGLNSGRRTQMMPLCYNSGRDREHERKNGQGAYGGHMLMEIRKDKQTELCGHNSIKSCKCRNEQKHRYVQINSDAFFRYLCLVSVIAVMIMLCGCGYRGGGLDGTDASGMYTSTEEAAGQGRQSGITRDDGTSRAQDADTATGPITGQGDGSLPDADDAAQNSDGNSADHANTFSNGIDAGYSAAADTASGAVDGAGTIAGNTVDSTNTANTGDTAVNASGSGRSAGGPGNGPNKVNTGGNSSGPAVVDSSDLENGHYTYDFVVAFAGDINLADNWDNMQYCSKTENGIYDCISPELVQVMQEADITCINNEFTFSTRGTPLKNKAYKFRAHPSNVGILKEMGVDIVSLANNHVYDYGKESLIDTMATLKQAGIKYVGAGHDLDEAMEPVYFGVQGKTVAFVAASRAEKYKMTPQATKNSPGILRCYDTALFKQTIKKARENADYVIAYVHWGTEFTHKLEDVQLITGKEYLDAGADIVIGAHPHRLQGIEFYKGKPIIYSLGNFWFNDETVDTVLLKIRFFGNDTEEYIELEVVPAVQADLKTTIVNEQTEKKRIFSLLERISINAEISDKGIITERRPE